MSLPRDWDDERKVADAPGEALSSRQAWADGYNAAIANYRHEKYIEPEPTGTFDDTATPQGDEFSY